MSKPKTPKPKTKPTADQPRWPSQQALAADFDALSADFEALGVRVEQIDAIQRGLCEQAVTVQSQLAKLSGREMVEPSKVDVLIRASWGVIAWWTERRGTDDFGEHTRVMGDAEISALHVALKALEAPAHAASAPVYASPTLCPMCNLPVGHTGPCDPPGALDD